MKKRNYNEIIAFFAWFCSKRLKVLRKQNFLFENDCGLGKTLLLQSSCSDIRGHPFSTCASYDQFPDSPLPLYAQGRI